MGSSDAIVGNVVKLTGTAYLESDAGRVPLKVGSTVSEGAVIVTGEHSNVQLRMADDSYISQGENSHLELDEFSYDPDDADGSGLFVSLAKGAFRMITGFIARQNPDHVRFKTPTAVCGVRGTDFWVIVDENGEQIGVIDITDHHVLVV
ncbi:MAG: hypothetical protein GY700_14750, partial [Propionibacteriaceae bacterium]|nr:hypothetical protein [Propionibacteriaceae bacterium]